MNALRNKVQLIGNLGNDPEMFEFDGGKKKVKLSVATNEVYFNKEGEKVTDTQWHNVIAWGKIAERASKFLVKGQEIALEGKLVNRSYDDKDGNKKYITEVVVNDFLMLGKKE